MNTVRDQGNNKFEPWLLLGKKKQTQNKRTTTPTQKLPGYMYLLNSPPTSKIIENPDEQGNGIPQ